MDADVYYLSSLDSERFEPVRECQVIRSVMIGPDKPGVLVRLAPGVPGQDYGSGDDLTEFVLTTRFEGADVQEIEEFPCFVFVARALEPWDPESDRANPSDLEIVGWAELYRTRSDAQEHRFG
jgi:hypothetical protein